MFISDVRDPGDRFALAKWRYYELRMEYVYLLAPELKRKGARNPYHWPRWTYALGTDFFAYRNFSGAGSMSVINEIANTTSSRVGQMLYQLLIIGLIA